LIVGARASLAPTINQNKRESEKYFAPTKNKTPKPATEHKKIFGRLKITPYLCST
jgi:hypothetical protein